MRLFSRVTRSRDESILIFYLIKSAFYIYWLICGIATGSRPPSAIVSDYSFGIARRKLLLTRNHERNVKDFEYC